MILSFSDISAACMLEVAVVHGIVHVYIYCTCVVFTEWCGLYMCGVHRVVWPVHVWCSQSGVACTCVVFTEWCGLYMCGVHRVVWPDEGFGREGISVDEEMETMKAILFNPAAGMQPFCLPPPPPPLSFLLRFLPPSLPSSLPSFLPAIPAARLMTNIEDGEEEEEEEGEEEVGGGEVVSYETQFEIRKYIQRFVPPPSPLLPSSPLSPPLPSLLLSSSFIGLLVHCTLCTY